MVESTWPLTGIEQGDGTAATRPFYVLRWAINNIGFSIKRFHHDVKNIAELCFFAFLDSAHFNIDFHYLKD